MLVLYRRRLKMRALTVAIQGFDRFSVMINVFTCGGGFFVETVCGDCKYPGDFVRGTEFGK